MSNIKRAGAAELRLPHPRRWQQQTSIPAPSHEDFISKFGDAFPEPKYLESDLGRTAVYNLEPRLTQKKRPILMVHGIDTPALGMLPLAKALQALDPDAHIVLFDLWGDGLSSTPLVTHTPHIFHAQIHQVLGYMRWSSAHIVGYSFGGSTVVSFANDNPWMCLSATLLAPAGLLQYDGFDAKMRKSLEDTSGEQDGVALDSVLDFLEDGPLNVPGDARDKMLNGEVVAEALRAWELEDHPGHGHSMLSMFRHGGVYGQEARFRRFASLALRKFVIVGGTDPVCSKSQLTELGLDNVEVVENEGHAFIRSAATQAARLLHDFLLQI